MNRNIIWEFAELILSVISLVFIIPLAVVMKMINYTRQKQHKSNFKMKAYDELQNEGDDNE